MKTLKDIIYKVPTAGTLKHNYDMPLFDTYVSLEDLKAAAIEWVKEIEIRLMVHAVNLTKAGVISFSTKVEDTPKELVFETVAGFKTPLAVLYGRREMCKDFFNLTEEDLGEKT